MADTAAERAWLCARLRDLEADCRRFIDAAARAKATEIVSALADAQAAVLEARVRLNAVMDGEQTTVTERIDP